MKSQKGQVFGRAGGGLANGTPGWAANRGAANQGLLGEKATAKVLDHLVQRGYTVLHDLKIPDAHRGATKSRGANVDHIVCWSEGGKQIVVLIDSKCWRGGAVFWRLGTKAFRNGRRFKVTRIVNGKKVDDYPGDKQTLPWARDAYPAHLRQRCGSNVEVRTALLVVWPSQKGKSTRVGLLSGSGVKAIHGDRLTAQFPGTVEPADPRLVEALRALLVKSENHIPTDWF